MVIDTKAERKTVLVRSEESGKLFHITPSEYRKILSKDLGYIYTITGPRGSGKTLFMTYLGIHDAMMAGHKVWANYPIECWVDSMVIPGKVYHLKSLPLNIEQVLLFDQQLAEGYVLIDEINLWASSRRSMSVANRLISDTLQLIRKRRLTFIFTTQNFKWMDSRIRWQTDFLCECKDTSDNHDGRFIEILMQDWSGVKSGYAVSDGHFIKDVNAVVLKFEGWPYHGTYNTWQEFDTVQASAPVRMLNDKTILDFRGGKRSVFDGAAHKSAAEEALQTLEGLGVTKVSSGDVQNLFVSHGAVMSSKAMGKFLRDHGWNYTRGRDGNFYERLDK